MKLDLGVALAALWLRRPPRRSAKLVHALLCALLLVGSTFNFQLSTAQSADSVLINYAAGVRLSVEGDAAGALRHLERALAADPDHDPSLYEAAIARLGSGQGSAQALEYAQRAMALDPQNRWYKELTARLLMNMARYDEALEIYEELTTGGARATKRFDPDSWQTLALLYYEKGRPDDALSALDSIELHMGQSAELVALRRGMLLDSGRMSDAMAATEKYVAQAPYDENNRLALAEMYAYQGLDSLSHAVLRQVLAINPNNAKALELLSPPSPAPREETVQTLLSRGDLEGALRVLKKEIADSANAKRTSPAVNETQFQPTAGGGDGLSADAQADATLNLRQDEAVSQNEPRRGSQTEARPRGGLKKDSSHRELRSEEAAPAPLETYTQIIEIEAYMRRVDSVAMYSEMAIGAYPREAQLYLLQATAMQFLGRPAEAMQVAERGLKIAATDILRSDFQSVIGSLHHESGDNKRAFAAYTRALRLNPANTLVLNNFAYYLAIEAGQKPTTDKTRDRDLQKSLEMSRKAIAAEPVNATYLDTYAWVLYLRGDYAEAKKVMGQALPLDREKSPELMMHYGDILWALGEDFMAALYWRRARDAGYQPVAEIEERLNRKR